jgi:hypothetical protein
MMNRGLSLLLVLGALVWSAEVGALTSCPPRKEILKIMDKTTTMQLSPNDKQILSKFCTRTEEIPPIITHEDIMMRSTAKKASAAATCATSCAHDSDCCPHHNCVVQENANKGLCIPP